MATSSLNPGVGPTNADIAAAVAAPSAATIAAAVAAPSAATIASTVAGSVPTLAQITSTVQANAGSPFGGTYTNLGTTNLPQNATTYTLTGLSGYKYLKIGCNFLIDGPTNTPIIRFNSDSSSLYLQTNRTIRDNSTTPLRTASDLLGFFRPSLAGAYTFGSNVRMRGYITIKNATSGAYKEVEMVLGDSSYSYGFEVYGIYLSTSAITSMSISSTELTGNIGGSLYVIGAN